MIERHDCNGTHMSAESKTTANPDLLGALARIRGLERAYVLFPDVVAAAYERAARGAGPLPKEVSPTTEPATAFDAGRFQVRP
jgi:hypothetical protein